MISTAASARQVRREVRQMRRGLAKREQARRSRIIQRRLAGWLPYLRAQSVAVFFSADGEPDLAPLIRDAWRSGKAVYLPLLHPFSGSRLWFAPWREKDSLQLNRFLIPEPVPRYRKPVNARHLDMVLIPLVAFDSGCARIGMGGGFYDRTLAYRRHHRCWQRPLLVGVAHEFQRMEEIVINAWDIPLDAVVTEACIHTCV